MFLLAASVPPVPDPDKLTPADPSDLAAALAFSLRYQVASEDGSRAIRQRAGFLPKTCRCAGPAQR